VVEDQSWLSKNLGTVPLTMPWIEGGRKQVRTVLLCFLLNVTDLLGDLLQAIFVVCILHLQL